MSATVDGGNGGLGTGQEWVLLPCSCASNLFAFSFIILLHRCKRVKYAPLISLLQCKEQRSFDLSNYDFNAISNRHLDNSEPSIPTVAAATALIKAPQLNSVSQSWPSGHTSMTLRSSLSILFRHGPACGALYYTQFYLGLGKLFTFQSNKGMLAQCSGKCL